MNLHPSKAEHSDQSYLLPCRQSKLKQHRHRHSDNENINNKKPHFSQIHAPHEVLLGNGGIWTIVHFKRSEKQSLKLLWGMGLIAPEFIMRLLYYSADYSRRCFIVSWEHQDFVDVSQSCFTSPYELINSPVLQMVSNWTALTDN